MGSIPWIWKKTKLNLEGRDLGYGCNLNCYLSLQNAQIHYLSINSYSIAIAHPKASGKMRLVQLRIAMYTPMLMGEVTKYAWNGSPTLVDGFDGRAVYHCQSILSLVTGHAELSHAEICYDAL